ncbi:unnamed protein product, partial [Prorocentrum cordatum]
ESEKVQLRQLKAELERYLKEAQGKGAEWNKFADRARNDKKEARELKEAAARLSQMKFQAHQAAEMAEGGGRGEAAAPGKEK